MKKLLIGLIHFYQRHISSATAPSCRFTPTCSAYAIQAIERFGALKGTGLAVWRILRCNPLCRPGYDPVPEKKPRRRKFNEK
ncbi:MAG: membrane protein insertion efficiency factor YidD [Clostridiales bacterium]|jgi:putative membrane protein insertion efficiency factor|nr:membrane protein insertion efficiency factor YidD [Clostridiales bacterium]